MLLSSSNISWNLLSGAIFVSIIISIQYLHSEASFNAMEYFDRKSALDWANSASAQFAPIDVPERRNCFDNTFAASSQSGDCRHCYAMAKPSRACFLLNCT